jgi:hypothetical protein
MSTTRTGDAPCSCAYGSYGHTLREHMEWFGRAFSFAGMWSPEPVPGRDWPRPVPAPPVPVGVSALTEEDRLALGGYESVKALRDHFDVCEADRDRMADSMVKMEDTIAARDATIAHAIEQGAQLVAARDEEIAITHRERDDVRMRLAAHAAELARYRIAFQRTQGALTDAGCVVVPDEPEQVEDAVKALDEEIARLRAGIERIAAREERYNGDSDVLRRARDLLAGGTGTLLATPAQPQAREMPPHTCRHCGRTCSSSAAANGEPCLTCWEERNR